MGSMTPLDLALRAKQAQCVHALVATQDPTASIWTPVGAHLGCYKKAELDEFLAQHPQVMPQKNAEDKIMWVPEKVRLCMREGTLLHLKEEEIRQGLCMGTLPCAWSSVGAWPAIQRRAAEHEANRQKQPLADDQQEHDLSALLQFAERVIPIERELVEKLEAELSKNKPHLAALDDNASSQPKLSLMLNCMGVDAPGIAATSTMDLTEFLNKSKRANVFVALMAPEVDRNTVLDLLYCGELAREAKFPFVGHEDECPVCSATTADALVNFVMERGIQLNHQSLREKGIHGTRVLYCTEEDFPNQPPKEVYEAVEALQAIHEEHM